MNDQRERDEVTYKHVHGDKEVCDKSIKRKTPILKMCADILDWFRNGPDTLYLF